ncbi:MAG: FliA/WhiG family RNA polymerase sigma factor [Nannocystaceae bacterium]|nr:FliA/WhiG family RNA polymerase sigma factor [Nannocystaceae bacterium]
MTRLGIARRAHSRRASAAAAEAAPQTSAPASDTAANSSLDHEHARVEVGHEPAANEAPVRPRLDATRYLEFVRRIATRMARSLPAHVSLDDLIGAGTLGLLDAMDRFDPSKADRFETFAEFRIKGAILDELRRYDLMARNARLTAKRLARKTQELTARLGRPPSEAEIADALEMSHEDYRRLVDRIGSVRVLSLEDLQHGDEGNDRAAELSAKILGPDEATGIRELHARLRNAIAGLPERQQLILDMYYHREMTLKEIGLQVGVTESRVCQIMGEATGRLRHLLRHG